MPTQVFFEKDCIVTLCPGGEVKQGQTLEMMPLRKSHRVVHKPPCAQTYMYMYMYTTTTCFPIILGVVRNSLFTKSPLTPPPPPPSAPPPSPPPTSLQTVFFWGGGFFGGWGGWKESRGPPFNYLDPLRKDCFSLSIYVSRRFYIRPIGRFFYTFFFSCCFFFLRGESLFFNWPRPNLFLCLWNINVCYCCFFVFVILIYTFLSSTINLGICLCMVIPLHALHLGDGINALNGCLLKEIAPPLLHVHSCLPDSLSVSDTLLPPR